MANAPGRKKSIASNPGVVIETPVASNNILNKAASQSTSLYQQCSSLHRRLMRIPDFAGFFLLSPRTGPPHQPSDPVNQIWDCFSLGISLCFLFNLLPSKSSSPIVVDTNAATFAVNDERARKHAIANFSMRIKEVENCEQFSVTDLLNRNSKDGLVKVVKMVTTIVDLLPPEIFEPVSFSSPLLTSDPSIGSLVNEPPLTAVPANAYEAACHNIVKELLDTERKYEQDLEIMQKYASQLFLEQTLPQDQIHLLFPGLKQILSLQRDFLIILERIAENPWKEQRWGSPFIEQERNFDVYEPYCANYYDALELMVKVKDALRTNTLIDADTELPGFLIKPIQRICKYPLILDSLVKAASSTDYPHYEELRSGAAAAKRIADRINEAQRREENLKTVHTLEQRVKDWKGHHLSNFGNLLLDDVFTVTKSEVDREYHVFLFEKIILCCKEALPPPPGGKKAKNNSLLKKQTASSPAPVPVPNKEKDSTLLLKGRIFLNNVTQAVPTSPRNSIGSSAIMPYSLAVWWRGDDDLEYFTLRCRSEEQLKQWETQINRLIREAANRRASERSLSQIVSHSSHASNPASLPQQLPLPHVHDRASSSISYASYSRTLLPASAVASSSGSHYGFEYDLEDEMENYPPSASVPSSGRGTPLGTRRMNTESLPPERNLYPSQDRPRARTEAANGHVMEQWRAHHSPLPPPPGAAAAMTPAYRSMPPHVITNVHTDPTFGSGGRRRAPPHTHINSSLLRAPGDHGALRSATPSPSLSYGSVPMHRSRSASQPGDYVPKGAFAPVPATGTWTHRSQGSNTSESKRGSGSSRSTRGSFEEDSPNSSSPVTPFGSSESSLGGSALRTSRSQTFDSLMSNGAPLQPSTAVKVKVHYKDDLFVITVPRSTEFSDLIVKVENKIRLCSDGRDDGPFRVRYKDEDGDMISLNCTEDVGMAFESFLPGGSVVLYVT